MAADSEGNIYMTDPLNNLVHKLDNVGNVLTSWGVAGSDAGQFDEPFGIAVDQDDYVYVSDLGNDRVYKFTSDGVFLSQWGGPGVGPGEFNDPTGLAVDFQNSIYVVDSHNHRVQKFGYTSPAIPTTWGRIKAKYGLAP